MAWTTALPDLRKLLFDDVDGKYFYRKKCFGQLNGSNQSFKTFDPRRLTDFTDADLSAAPLGIYVGGVRVDSDAVVSDDVITGEFILEVPPTNLQGVEATYYVQQFTDEELISFLTNTSKSFLQMGEDYTLIPLQLQMSALQYTVSQCLLMLSMRWTLRASDAFLVEDSPKKEAQGVAKTFADLAQVFSRTATASRNDSYATSAGQSLSPNFVSNFGQVRAIVPRR